MKKLFNLFTLVLLFTPVSILAAGQSSVGCTFSLEIKENKTKFSDEQLIALWQMALLKTANQLQYCPSGRSRSLFVSADDLGNRINFNVKDSLTGLGDSFVTPYVVQSQGTEFADDHGRSINLSLDLDFVLEHKINRSDAKLFIDDFHVLSLRNQVGDLRVYRKIDVLGKILDSEGPLKSLEIINSLWRNSIYNFAKLTIDNKEISLLLRQPNAKEIIDSTMRAYRPGEAFSHILFALNQMRPKLISFWLRHPFTQIDLGQSDCKRENKMLVAGSFVIQENKVQLCMRDFMETHDSNGKTKDLMNTTIHEFGHHFYFNLPTPKQNEFNFHGWTNRWLSWKRKENVPPISDYGMTNPVEDFAESFKYYFLGELGVVDFGGLGFLNNPIQKNRYEYMVQLLNDPDVDLANDDMSR